jgi:hypothetical protein
MEVNTMARAQSPATILGKAAYLAIAAVLSGSVTYASLNSRWFFLVAAGAGVLALGACLVSFRARSRWSFITGLVVMLLIIAATFLKVTNP